MGRIILVLSFIVGCAFGLSPLNRSGLVAFYPMTQQTGNVLLDTKGGDKLVGVSNPYIKNASAYTDGTASYYEATNQLALKSLTNKVSCSFWCKRNTTTSAGLITCVDLGVPIGIWNVQNTATGQFQMVIIAAPTTTTGLATGTSYTSAGVWRHFVGVYDGTQSTAANRIKLYVNGVDVSGGLTPTGTIPTALQNPANTTFRIGKGTGAALGDSYIKFLEIYNRPLTPTEVKNIYVEKYNKVNQSQQ